MKAEAQIAQQYERIRHSLTERTRREWAGSEALALGHGGIALVHRATGIAPSTIGRGVRDIKAREANEAVGLERDRVRRPGGGRPKKVDEDPGLLSALERLVDPVSRGDPESPLRWTCKSLRNLEVELKAQGHQVSYRTVGTLLHSLGYSLQANRKTVEGKQHVDRNAQFEYINAQATRQHEAGNPVISVDTKKKELVGNYKNAGREHRPKGEPDKVDVHDFIGDLGRASPYGVYDVGENVGWVSVGISADTSRRGRRQPPVTSHLPWVHATG